MHGYSQNQMDDFGKRLRALRKKAKLSQSAIAERLGMDSSNYSKYERDRVPMEETLERIGKGLGYESLAAFEEALAAVVIPKEIPQWALEPGDELLELRALLNRIELTRDRYVGLKGQLRAWLEDDSVVTR